MLMYNLSLCSCVWDPVLTLTLHLLVPLLTHAVSIIHTHTHHTLTHTLNYSWYVYTLHCRKLQMTL